MSIIELKNKLDWEGLLARSELEPILVLKHSTQCPISAAAFQEFQTFAAKAVTIDCVVVRVIESRELSDTIAAHLDIRHESPQAILIEKGRATWHASRWSVTAEGIDQAVKHSRNQASPI